MAPSPSPVPPPTQAAIEPGASGRSEIAGSEKKSPGMGRPADPEIASRDRLFQGGLMIIPFGFNANELPPEILSRLDELTGFLLAKPNAEIIIRGYTDAQGTPDYNRNLSTFRANVVKSYLTGKGISSNRMKVMGMGNAAPRMPNTSSEGRSANRRVEIELASPK